MITEQHLNKGTAQWAENKTKSWKRERTI